MKSANFTSRQDDDEFKFGREDPDNFVARISV